MILHRNFSIVIRNMSHMKKVTLLLTGLAMLMVSPSAFAYRTNPSDEAKAGGGPSKSASAGCLPPSSSAELNVNNVRALIHSGGDMWWDLIANPRYEIPKGSGRHSMFLGTLWIAGRDQSTQTLRVAAQRYRSRGVDFWTGPLDRLGTAEVDPETCELYDQIWTITRQQVELFRLCNCIAPDDVACEGYSVPESIRRWPGNPIPQSNGQHLNMEPILAPFADVNGDGVYRWEDCDYPFYDLDNTIDCTVDRSAFLYGDFTLWWVFNDKGNIHGETQGPPIGMEIRAQGFGFNTNDEINNMTFYNYQLINRGTTTLGQCYFGVNTDADIGGAFDDYTGCDVARGFGFMYNGDAFDENFAGSLGYGANPPAIGMDFFEGPYLDSNGVAIQFDPADIPNLTDTTRFSGAYAINGLGFNDTIPDNERYGMRRYVYYNNGNCITCDPQNFPEYYNMLRGVWKDNTRMVFGGNGYPAPGNGSTTIIADFMFPGDSDPLNWGTRGVVQPFEWREQNTGAAPNTPGDRRFVQSAGPFTLKPGLVNDITVGVVWARTSTGDPYESVIRVLAADQKAQSLFENCFRVLNGPDAPDMNIVELDRELILYLTNRPTSNNYLEEYDELNYFIPEFDFQTRALTQDTIIWVPAWKRIDIVNGDSVYVYNQQVVNGNTADTTINVYDSGGNVTGVVYGFLINPSNAVLTTINLGTTQDTTFFDRQIRFEGYLIYQLRDPTVTATDVFGVDGSTKARLVAQCDIRNFDEVGNPIGRIINYQFDEDLNASVPRVMVNGANEGIVHSFRITEDQFAVGDKRLVNHKTYHFMALAYGYNNFKPFDPNDATMLDGQKEPFFLGRRNIRTYSGIPRIPAPGLGGTILNSLYGTSPPITRVEGRGNGGNDIQLNEETERRILESPEFKTDTLVYELNRGPVNIKVIDPLRVRPANYALKIVGSPTSPQGTILAPTARWILFERNADGTLDTVAFSEKDLSGRNEQIVFDRRSIPDVDPFLGFSITIRQPLNLGPFWRTVSGALVTERERENGFVASSINFRDPFHVWLGFFPDINGPTPANWVRSGTTESTDNPAFNSNFFTASTGGAGGSQTVFIDPEAAFERNISFFGGGGIVPYFLVGSSTTYSNAPGGPVLPAHQLGALEVIGGSGGVITVAPFRFTIGSVDIVLTPDRSLWSRCPVFETQDFPELAFTDTGLTGQPRKLAIRHSPSVDKWGRKANTNAGPSTDPESPNFVSPWGYSWFPGYVIDVETGERLNIAFGEDSFLGGVNGRDMLFNPAVTDLSTGQGVISQFGEYLAAGKHFMYIFSSTRPESVFQQGFPRYDHGEAFKEYLLGSNGLPLNNPSVSQRRNLWRNCSWAGIPFHVRGKEWLNNPVRISLRVSKPYERNWTATTQSSEPQNDNRPLYYFNMGELAPVKGDVATARSALDLIQVVPNPYYANSAYETSQLDNRVKIVNLPDVCTITIYALNGTLVRRFEKGTNDLTSIDWDLMNYARIPIASGLYIIHIKAPGIGERIVKWFGVIRPIDLDSF
jgi:hypothetical protein